MKTANRYINCLRTILGDDKPKVEEIHQLTETFQPYAESLHLGFYEGIRLFMVLFKDKSIVIVFEDKYESTAFDLDDPEEAKTFDAILDKIIEHTEQSND